MEAVQAHRRDTEAINGRQTYMSMDEQIRLLQDFENDFV